MHLTPQEPPRAASRAWGSPAGREGSGAQPWRVSRAGVAGRRTAPSARGSVSRAKGRRPGPKRSPHVHPVTAVAVQNPGVGEGKPAPPAGQERGEKVQRPGCPWLPGLAVGAAHTSEHPGEPAHPSLHPGEPAGPGRELGVSGRAPVAAAAGLAFGRTGKAVTAQERWGEEAGGSLGGGCPSNLLPLLAPSLDGSRPAVGAELGPAPLSLPQVGGGGAVSLHLTASHSR